MKSFQLLFLTAVTTFYFSAARSQWVPSGSGNGSGVTHCFIESGGVLLSGGNGSGIYKSINQGDLWEASNTGITPSDEILCFGKNSHGVFAGANQSIYFSDDDGTTWTSVNSSGNTTFALAFSGDTVFAASIGGGIIKSEDNGGTWSSANSGIPTLSVYSLIAKGNSLFAGTVGEGVFTSSNGGLTWIPVNNGFPLTTAVRYLETDGTKIYAGTRVFFNPNLTAQGMYVSEDDGNSWQQVSGGISSTSNVYNITCIGNSVLSAAHDVYLSLDNGTNWVSFMDGIDPTCPYGASGFYETSEYIFCGLEGGCNGSVFRIPKGQIVSGIEEELNPVSLIYPNPTTDLIRIEVASNFHHATLNLFNELGVLVDSELLGTASSFKYNLPEAKGLYFVQLLHGNGYMESVKVVKE